MQIKTLYKNWLISFSGNFLFTTIFLFSLYSGEMNSYSKAEKIDFAERKEQARVKKPEEIIPRVPSSKSKMC